MDETINTRDQDALNRLRDQYVRDGDYAAFEQAVHGLLTRPYKAATLWYVLKDGVPVPEPDSIKAAMFFGDIRNRRVAEDTFTAFDGTEIRVSTVFLCLDHGWGDGPPVLWESMIFWPGNEELDEEQVRYTSRQEAEEGHQLMVAMVKRALGQE